MGVDQNLPTLTRNLQYLNQPCEGLYTQDQVPEDFKERGILRGYRNPNSTPLDCIRSIFKATNETINVWTHFIPGLCCLIPICQLYNDMDILSNDYAHPMLVYLICAMVFPCMSASAHMFNTMSEGARHICFFMDYVGLAIYSLGSAFAIKAYIFPQAMLRTTFSEYFLHIATFNAILAVLLSCQTRFRRDGVITKMMRFSAFGWPYLFDNIPLAYRLLYGQPGEYDSLAASCYRKQYIFAFLSPLFYISHFPEGFFPGQFDIVGHSHQFFHMCGVFATWYQIKGVLLDMNNRKDFLLEHNTIPSAEAICTFSLCMFVGTFLIIAYYIQKMYNSLSSAAADQNQIYKTRADINDNIESNGPKKKL